MGGAARPSDDYFEAYCFCAFREINEPVWRPVRRDDQGCKADLKFAEKGGGVAHRLPIRFAAHDNRDGLFYKRQMGTQTFDVEKAAA
jgi:hypothetical protein